MNDQTTVLGLSDAGRLTMPPSVVPSVDCSEAKRSHSLQTATRARPSADTAHKGMKQMQEENSSRHPSVSMRNSCSEQISMYFLKLWEDIENIANTHRQHLKPWHFQECEDVFTNTHSLLLIGWFPSRPQSRGKRRRFDRQPNMADDLDMSVDELDVFINMLETHVLLWDPTDPSYKNRPLKHSAHLAIAQVMGKGWFAGE